MHLDRQVELILGKEFLFAAHDSHFKVHCLHCNVLS